MGGGVGGSVKDVKSKGELDSLRQSNAPLVLHLWVSWCDASKHMDQVFSHLSTDFPNSHFLRVEAEEQHQYLRNILFLLSPFFVFFKDCKLVDKLEGVDPSSLANKVGKVAGSINHGEAAAYASIGMATRPTVLETIQDLVKENGSS